MRPRNDDMNKKRESDAVQFDEKVERDAKAGKLDRLAEKALADHRAGRTGEL
jgi:hypothetical protein